MGRRHRRLGMQASSVPKAMTAPPIQSHTMKGCTMTRIVTGASG
jgi:hypothetical protein